VATSERVVTNATVTSHKVGLLYRVLCAPQYRGYWVTSIPPWPACFQVTFAVFLAAPAPAVLRSRVHPLVSFASFPEYSCLSSARRPQPTNTFRGVSLSFATSIREVHRATGFPVPAFVPPSAFLTLSTGSSFPYLAGLFRPAAASEIHLQGFSPVSV
jgi:hypothetical protein